jgi:hypothetical protein
LGWAGLERKFAGSRLQFFAVLFFPASNEEIIPSTNRVLPVTLESQLRELEGGNSRPSHRRPGHGFWRAVSFNCCQHNSSNTKRNSAAIQPFSKIRSKLNENYKEKAAFGIAATLGNRLSLT